MYFLYGFLVLAVALLIWRIVTPADFRINRRYLSRVLKDGSGQGPKKLRIERLPVQIPAGKPEEKVFFHVEAEFADGSQQDVSVQVFYPLEALQMERDKKKKPMATDDFNMTQNPATLGGQQTPQEEADRFKEDPLKEVTEEQKTIERKTAQLDAEIEQLKLLNRCTKFFPELRLYDRKEHIAVLEPVGAKRLDAVMHKGKEKDIEASLRNVLTGLADLHNAGEGLAARLLPGVSHNENLIKSQIAGSFEGYVFAGISLTEQDIVDAVEATALMWSAGSSLMGPKLVDASPRAFYTYKGEVRPIDFARVRRDITLLDVVEVLCDPSTPISPEQELILIRHYLEARFAQQEERSTYFLETLYLAVYYRMVLAGYLIKHFIALSKSSGEKRSALEIPYWNKSAIDKNIEALKYYLDQAEELTELRGLLVPKLDELKGFRIREQ